MPVDSLSESSAIGWWSRDSTEILHALVAAESLLALVLAAASILIFWIARSRRGYLALTHHYDLVPLTRHGPLRVGAHAMLTILREEPAHGVAVVLESLEPRSAKVSAAAGDASQISSGSSVALITPAGSAAYRFITTVKDAVRIGEYVSVELELPAWIERVQRRSCFRVPVNLPTTVARIDRDSPTVAPVRSTLAELSAGGLKVVVPFKPPKGAFLRVRIPLPTLEAFTFEVRVLRATPARRPHSSLWALGCEFLYMDETTRQRIAQACFEIEQASSAKAS